MRRVTVLEVVFLVVFWSWAFSAILFLRNTLLPRWSLAQTPDLLGLTSETVQFPATDGVQLEGWIIGGEDPTRPWLILCHGLGTNRADLLDIAAGLSREGFNLLLFDFRAHGNSAGRTTSFGWREQRDLEGALAFLGSRPEIPATPYGVYGISMGAAVALMTAARDERIGAVAAESPYTSLDDSIRHHVRLMYPWLPSVPFHAFVLSAYRLRFGVWPAHVSPEAAAERLSPRPLLLIHGAGDPRMPLGGIQRLYQRAGEPKELWVIEGAGHLGTYALEPATYLNRLSRFFRSALR